MAGRSYWDDNVGTKRDVQTMALAADPPATCDNSGLLRGEPGAASFSIRRICSSCEPFTRVLPPGSSQNRSRTVCNDRAITSVQGSPIPKHLYVIGTILGVQRQDQRRLFVCLARRSRVYN